MKWRDLALTIALLLVLAPFVTGQTMPMVGSSTVSGGVGRFADGTAGTPSISFTSIPTSGLFVSGGAPAMSVNSTARVFFNQGSLQVADANQFAWSDSGLARLGAASISLTNSTTGKASLHTEGTALTLAIPAGGLGLATVSTTSVGNTGQGGRLVVVCGPTAGTGSLLFYAGTGNVPVTLANAVGAGLIGC